jgi:hypothetical protein
MLSQNEPGFSLLVGLIYGANSAGFIGFCDPHKGQRVDSSCRHSASHDLIRAPEVSGKRTLLHEDATIDSAMSRQPKFVHKHLTACQLRLNPTEAKKR